MKKKEVTVMNLNQEVEEMEGARRATGISSTSAEQGQISNPCNPRPKTYFSTFSANLARDKHYRHTSK